MTTKQDRRAATLKGLHEVDPFPCTGLADAVIQMAVRYGTVRALQTDTDLDYELLDRARTRRFGAMLRLVRALKRQS